MSFSVLLLGIRLFYHFFLAALIFAQRAFCVAAIRLRRAADIFFRGLTPPFAETLPAFSARSLPIVLASLLLFSPFQPPIFGALVALRSPPVFCTDTLPSPNNARTCCNRSISARTSLTMLSLLKIFPRVADATGQDSTYGRSEKLGYCIEGTRLKQFIDALSVSLRFKRNSLNRYRKSLLFFFGRSGHFFGTL